MSRSDMFIRIETAKAGLIKGESTDAGNDGEIDIVDWSWSMASPMQLANMAVTGKTQMHAVRFSKYADKASTGLMSTLYSHGDVKKAVITVRKAGGTAVTSFTMTLEKARLLSCEISSTLQEGGTPMTIEHYTMGFRKITVEYAAQAKDGARQGSASFTGEIQDN